MSEPDYTEIQTALALLVEHGIDFRGIAVDEGLFAHVRAQVEATPAIAGQADRIVAGLRQALGAGGAIGEDQLGNG